MTNMSDPDLHHAISLRPSPFHHYPERVRTSTPDPHRSSSQPPAKSSAYENTEIVSEEAPPRHRPAYSRNSCEGDAERQSLPNYNASQDPFNLSHGLKTEEEINGIKANTSRKRIAGVDCGLTNPKDVYRAKKLKGFYERQNENIERLLKPVDEHVSRTQRMSLRFTLTLSFRSDRQRKSKARMPCSTRSP